MNIILGYGFDNIHFGMLQQEIMAKLGKPDKKYESDYDFHLQYFFIRCDLWFSKEDCRLHWIESSNPELRIFDTPIFGKVKDDLTSFLNSQINDQIVEEDYGTFKTYCFENNWLSLSFEYDILTNIGFGHFWDENDEPIWITK